MKKLSSFLLAGLLFVSTLLAVVPSAFAQTTGDYVNNTHLSGQFSVPANLESGVNFTNKTNQTVTITASTEGTWNVSSDLKNLGVDGAPSTYLPYLADSLKYLKYPDKKPFSLLAVNVGSNPPIAVQVDKQSKIKLAPGETISFLNNEIDSKYVPDAYNDNTGSITVKWSATTGEDLSHLANKEFIIRNRADCNSNGEYCDRYLTYVNDNRTSVVLGGKGNAGIPWKLIPVAGTTDQFIIRNRAGCDSNGGYCDHFLTYVNDNSTSVVLDGDKRHPGIPWKLIPVN